MSNIAQMAARLEKRPGKVEAFEIIRKARPDSPLSEKDLSVLYGFFLPPPPKRVKNILEWATLACDTKASYSFCKNVLVENSVTFTANPKQAHVVFSDIFDGDGWYDTQGGRIGEGLAIMPDINKAVLSAMSGENLGTIDMDSMGIRDTPTGLAYVLPWVNLGVNKTYFDAMYGAIEGPTITGDRNGSFAVFGTVLGHSVYAVIMPFKLPPC